jgi:hypothetical protein
MVVVHVNPDIDCHRHKVSLSKLFDMKISPPLILHLINVNTLENMAFNVIVVFKLTRMTIVGLVTQLIDMMGSMWKKKVKVVALAFGNKMKRRILVDFVWLMTI